MGVKDEPYEGEGLRLREGGRRVRGWLVMEDGTKDGGSYRGRNKCAHTQSMESFEKLCRWRMENFFYLAVVADSTGFFVASVSTRRSGTFQYFIC